MEYGYQECKTCSRKGDSFCIGCQPMMLPGGTFTKKNRPRKMPTLQAGIGIGRQSVIG